MTKKRKAVGKGPSGTTIAIVTGVGLLALYAINKKPVAPPPPYYPIYNNPNSGTTGLITAGSGLLSSLLNLFGNSSTPSAPNASSGGGSSVSNSPYGVLV